MRVHAVCLSARTVAVRAISALTYRPGCVHGAASRDHCMRANGVQRAASYRFAQSTTRPFESFKVHS